MIKLEGHQKIVYSQTFTLEGSIIDMNADVSNKQQVLSVGSEFSLLGLKYILVKTVYKNNQVYYQFIDKKGEEKNE